MKKWRAREAGAVKVALVHDWLTGMRGGEKCLEVLCELFPDAPLYTLLWVKGSVSETIERRTIHTSFIQRLPAAASRHRYYLPLFPRAIESFDLRGYDLIVSSSHCVAKGVRVPPGTCHLSYIYTPMRYVWDQFDAYFGPGRASWPVRMCMKGLRARLQRWDSASNDRVRAFVAISRHVAARVKAYYGRAATVLHPPVDWPAFQASEKDEGYYLAVSALAPYKRVDVAVEAANRAGFPLKIIGSGQEERRLRRMAGSSVEVLGWQSDQVVRRHYAGCKALLFPGEEDFGLAPLEAMACGKPVIAYGKGGATETVIPLVTHHPSPVTSFAPTGIFFDEQTPDALIDAVLRFERHRDAFDAASIRERARSFDRPRFVRELRRIIGEQHHAFTGC